MKFLVIIAIAAVFAACNNTTDPTVIRFTVDQNSPVSVQVNTEYQYVAKVKVDNQQGDVIMKATELPSWLTFTDNKDKSATLKGTPTEVGTYNVAIEASNNGVSTTQAYTIVVTTESVDPNPNGSGTEESPYNVAAASANQGKSAFVKGYIVGYAVSGASTSFAFSSDTCTQHTNLLIADTKTETNPANCLTVQLPSGAVRNALNLRDNKGNLSKEVLLYGSLEAYFQQPGLKNVSYYKLEDGTSGGTKPVDPTGAVLNETLLTQESFNKFTAFSVIGTQTWTFSAQYGAMISGYEANASHQNEDWFITPALDMTGKVGTLTFDHARGPAGSINVGVAEGYYTVWVSNDYTSGDPTTASWTQIPNVTHGTVAWGFVSSSALTIPAANLAANCRIAFKYLCTDTESATWEIKNVIIK